MYDATQPYRPSSGYCTLTRTYQLTTSMSPVAYYPRIKQVRGGNLGGKLK